MADQGDVIEINSKKKILILAANPKNTERLRFGKEVSKIKEGIRRSKYRDQFEIHSELAIDFTGFRRALLDYEPHIVHFIGHGSEEGIVLEDENGFAEFISPRKLSWLFKLCSHHVECVILNACYTASQANAINKHIYYVIGMRKEIEDKAAIEFAVGFYDALGAGKAVEVAFEFGCNAALDKCPNLPQNLIPFLKERRTKLLLSFSVLLIIVVVSLLLHLLISKKSSQIERVETRGNILIAFNTVGKQWEKKFHSQISRFTIDDIDKDKENDILLGFSADGNEGGRVIALDSKRKEKWRFSYNPSYSGASGVKLGVYDMKVFDENQDRIVAVLLRNELWDLSVLVILNSKGKKLRKFWYPGEMHQIEKIKNTYIIRAVNNDLRQAKMSRNHRGNFSVIFALKYENIYGEAPPYLGMSKKNVHFEWYFFLSDQKVKFKKLSVLGEVILAPTTCGKGFYFNEKGPSDKVHFSDDHSCKNSLQLAELGITIKENGDINLSIPALIPTTERPIEIEGNLLDELREKGLLEKLRDAGAYCDAGSFDGENKALTLYREVIKELSPGVRQTSKLLNEAENDFKNKHYIHALRKYKTLFDEIINNSEGNI